MFSFGDGLKVRSPCVTYAPMRKKPPKERPTLLPQFHAPDWMIRRVAAAVRKAQSESADPNYCKADWMREAVREKLDRDLGPMD